MNIIIELGSYQGHVTGRGLLGGRYWGRWGCRHQGRVSVQHTSPCDYLGTSCDLVLRKRRRWWRRRRRRRGRQWRWGCGCLSCSDWWRPADCWAEPGLFAAAERLHLLMNTHTDDSSFYFQILILNIWLERSDLFMCKYSSVIYVSAE